MSRDEEILDPALSFDRWQFNAAMCPRQSGTLMNRALPAEYFARDRAGRLGYALRALALRRLNELAEQVHEEDFLP